MERSTNKGLTAICDILTVAGNITSNILVVASKTLAYTVNMLRIGTKVIGIGYWDNIAVRINKRSENYVKRLLLLRVVFSYIISKYNAKSKRRKIY